MKKTFLNNRLVWEIVRDYALCFPGVLLIVFGLFLGKTFSENYFFTLFDFKWVLLYLIIHAVITIAFVFCGDQSDVRNLVVRIRSFKKSAVLFWAGYAVLVVLAMCFSAWGSVGLLGVFFLAFVLKKERLVMGIAIALLGCVAAFALIFSRGFESEALMFIIVPCMVASIVRTMVARSEV